MVSTQESTEDNEYARCAQAIARAQKDIEISIATLGPALMRMAEALTRFSRTQDART